MFEKNMGQEFELLIEWANMQYLDRGKGVIQKIATPWKVERRFNPVTKKQEIITAYPEEKSTVDFGGTAQSRSIWFDAKTTKNKTSFPLANIKDHQIAYLELVHQQGGIGFFLIYSQVKNTTWLLRISDLTSFIKKNERKSLPFDWLDENCAKVKSKNGIAIDYLSEALNIQRGQDI